MNKQQLKPLKDLNLTSRFLYDAVYSDSARIRQIHKQVCKVKQIEEVGMRYLRELEEKYYAEQEGMERGIAQGIEQGESLRLISLVQKKIARGKSLEISAEELEMECEELKTIYQTVQQHQAKSARDILNLLNMQK